VERLWEEFKLKASADARERLLLHYAPRVKYVAGRVSVGLPNIEQADLVAYGIFGLIDAIEKIRSRTGHQVRDVRDLADQGRDHRRAAGDRLDPAVGSVQGPRGREGLRRPGDRLHRSPTDAEVAQQLGITTDELHQIFNQISFVSVVALDELLSVGSERGDRLSLVDTWRTRAPRTRWPCSSPRR
jgi:RNA polymerase sigma factor for flagellar operon FliA